VRKLGQGQCACSEHREGDHVNCGCDHDIANGGGAEGGGDHSDIVDADGIGAMRKDRLPWQRCPVCGDPNCRMTSTEVLTRWDRIMSRVKRGQLRELAPDVYLEV